MNRALASGKYDYLATAMRISIRGVACRSNGGFCQSQTFVAFLVHDRLWSPAAGRKWDVAVIPATSPKSGFRQNQTFALRSQ
jgi:hypothetical protein